MPTKTLTTNQVEWLLRDPGATLICVLDCHTFERSHIPGSRNVPVGSGLFVDRIRSMVDGLQSLIIVYDSGREGETARWAAEALLRAGFTEVFCYGGGLRAWIGAGKTVHRGHGAMIESTTDIRRMLQDPRSPKR